MKSFTGTVAAAALAINGASAHYIFNQLSVAGTQYGVYEYIRPNTNGNSPVTDLASTDLRCNVGGATGEGTDTLTVAAGDSFTFSLDTPVYHQGPISIYMSPVVPEGSGASSYDGSGPWFKTADFGPDFSTGQAVWDLSGSYTSSIPTCIAPGTYLLRIQSLAIHNPWPAGIPQFYISCAQVEVTGGSGTASGFEEVEIPGAFKETDPGYTVNIYDNFTNYTVPGPAPLAC